MPVSTEPEVRITPFGAPATAALAEVIDRAKHDDPLAAVTVIVASNVAGLSARRIIGASTGLANVGFVTPFQLAELLGGTTVGETPLTNPVLAAAVRQVLRTDPGGFEQVADHHATERALVAAYAELSHVRPATLDAVGRSGAMSNRVVRFCRHVQEALAGFHDEDDLMRAARDVIVSNRATAELGHVVWFLPDRVTPATGEFLAAVVGSTRATVVVGITGDRGADAVVLQALAAAGVVVDAVAFQELGPDRRASIVSVSDPDEEVRAVLRRVLALAEEGVPFDRMAVLHPLPDPYARTIHEQFAAAGVPHNGPSRVRLVDRVAGRTLLALLDVGEDRFSRAAVLALVSGGPLRHDGRAAPVNAWERISRDAGVVGGLDDWRSKLRAHAETERAAGHEHTAAQADGLHDFVESLALHVQRIDGADTWAAKADAVRWALGRLLGPENRRIGWPDEEVDAASRLDAALSQLAEVDEIDPSPTATAFRLGVAAELDAPAGRIGRFGEGVLVGPLAMAPGLDLDAVFVVGMAEGTCPTRRREDALLPDEARTRAAGELLTRDGRLQQQHRALLAALASAGHRVLTFPRGDLRSGRRTERLPSRWLLAAASEVRGGETPVLSSHFAELGPDVVTEVPSFLAGLGGAPAAASLVERDVAAVLAHLEAGGSVVDHPAVGGAVERGLQQVAARRGAGFTEWDGNLTGLPVPDPLDSDVLSATRLEQWAACGFRYFLSSVLRIKERDDPELITELRANDRGTLVHAVLERFVREAIERPGGPPAPDEPWTEADRDRLHAIATEEFDELEGKGLTGRHLLWRQTQEEVRADLDEMLVRDGRHRREQRLTPVDVELAFGSDDAEPVVLDLPHGRARFRGKVDRVDAGPHGHAVVDYKTGKDHYAKLDDDPFQAGTTLQLGLYAEAARQRLGAGPVDTAYWMITARGEYKWRGYRWDDAKRARFLDVVDTIVEGIGGGLFAANPGEYNFFWRTNENCRFCPYDRVCPRDRDDHARAMVGAEELRIRDRLTPASEPS